LDVRHNDEGLGKRSRWAFFSSLLVIPLRVVTPQDLSGR
jgi:hypothetical protein